MELGGWDYFWRIFLYSVPELMRDSLSCIGQSVAQSVSGVAANIFKTSFEDRWFHAVSCVFFLSILWKSLSPLVPNRGVFLHVQELAVVPVVKRVSLKAMT